MNKSPIRDMVLHRRPGCVILGKRDLAQNLEKNDKPTRDFHRKVARNRCRETCDALTGFLKEHSPSIQDSQLGVYEDPQGLDGDTPELPRRRRTLFKHLFWVFQGQDAQRYANLRRTQSHTVKFTHHFYHSADDLLDLRTCHCCRVNSSCVGAQHRVPYLAHMVVRRTRGGHYLVFHILQVGAHLDAARVRAAAVCRRVG